MHIKSVEFAGAIGQPGQAPPTSIIGLPQVAFAGRSNVGKSSLINRLLGRTRTPIARVSGRPGKTQEINFYLVRSDVGEFCLVDLPGYGYARAPEALRARWRPLINGFLAASDALVGVVQLLDIRHPPSADDRTAIAFLAELALPVLFVPTKSDKLGTTQQLEATARLARTLDIDPDQLLPVSARQGAGIEDLLDSIGELVGRGNFEF